MRGAFSGLRDENTAETAAIASDTNGITRTTIARSSCQRADTGASIDDVEVDGVDDAFDAFDAVDAVDEFEAFDAFDGFDGVDGGGDTAVAVAVDSVFVSLTRRSLCRSCVAWLVPFAAPAARARAERARDSQLRLVAHRTLLVEAGGARLLIDPASTALPRDLGRLDFVAFTAAERCAARTFAHVDVDGVRALVPDDASAARARRIGFRAVRVVVPFDVVPVAAPAGFDVVVTASPARPGCVGFHVRAPDMSAWCTGDLRPLDEDATAAAFAHDHPAGCVVSDAVDAATLADLAGGRVFRRR